MVLATFNNGLFLNFDFYVLASFSLAFALNSDDHGLAVKFF